MSCSCGGSCKDPVKFDVYSEFTGKTYGVIDTDDTKNNGSPKSQQPKSQQSGKAAGYGGIDD